MKINHLILKICILLCVLIFCLMLLFRCSSHEVKKSKYELCTESLRVSGWTLFGSVNINAASEGAVRECAKLAEIEIRENQIEKFAKNPKDLTAKQKLFFANHGIPQKVDWD